MSTTTWALVRGGRLELAEALDLPEGTRVLVTIPSADEDQEFWLAASRGAIDAVWDNPEDDVYARLLEG